MADSLLPQQVLRNLSDRSSEKRKLGASEIDKLIRRMPQEDVVRVVTLLSTDFALSPNNNLRKGGLLALAQCAVALGPGISAYLDIVVPPVLKNFADQEPRVRFYACESLYNIVKTCRASILPHLNDVFVGVCSLIADVDNEVRNGTALFDRLLREIVTDAASDSAVGVQGAEVAKRVVPLLRTHMGVVNPYVRQLLVGWITELDRVPGVDMLDHLGDLLEGLFEMLSDGNREVRSAAHNALAGFLAQIDCLPSEAFPQRLQLGTIITVLLAQLSRDREKFNRVTAVEWLAHFIQLGQVRLAPWYAGLVRALLCCLNDSEGELVRTVAKANTALMGLVRMTPRGVLEEGAGGGSSGSSGSSIFVGVLHSVCESCGAPDKLIRSASLRWLAMLLQQLPEAVALQREGIAASLLSNLVDTADPEVLKLNLEVLARLASIDRTWAFLKERVLVDLVRLFGEQRGLLETKAAFIIRRLCLLLDPTVVYLGLSDILAHESNMEFAALCVELLNLILLTSAELSDFRDSLRGCCDVVTAGGCSSSSSSRPAGASKEVAVFLSLFRSWVCNPVATISLCLLVHAYELSSRLVTRVIDMQVTVGLLMQVDKLVQLIESPVFLDVRMALLTPRRPSCSELLTTLYGLLMILPQGTAYATLKDRLSAVSSLHFAQGLAGGGGGGGGGSSSSSSSSSSTGEGGGAGSGGRAVDGLDVGAAEAIFAASQHLFREALSAEIRSRSVLGAREGGAPGAAAAAAAAPPPGGSGGAAGEDA